jgi:hypothetical protein
MDEELLEAVRYNLNQALRMERNVARITRAIRRAEQCRPSLKRDHRVYMLIRAREWANDHCRGYAQGAEENLGWMRKRKQVIQAKRLIALYGQGNLLEA